MEVIVVATHNERYFDSFIDSLYKYNIKPTILGWNQKYTGHLMKDNLLEEYLSKNTKKRIILFCDAFDCILVSQSISINGVTDVVLTKLDVLDELKEIKICVGYKDDNKIYDYLPFDANIQKKLQPVYETLPGWKSSTFAIEFNNKEWVMFKLKNNLSNRIHIKDFKLHFSQFFAEEKKQENPFQ